MSERDTHFAGFAKLLERELSEVEMQRIRSIESGALSSGEEFAEQLRLLIARRAYDLANHVLRHTDIFTWDAYSQIPMELMAEDYPIPDLTEWPVERNES